MRLVGFVGVARGLGSVLRRRSVSPTGGSPVTREPCDWDVTVADWRELAPRCSSGSRAFESNPLVAVDAELLESFKYDGCWDRANIVFMTP